MSARGVIGRLGNFVAAGRYYRRLSKESSSRDRLLSWQRSRLLDTVRNAASTSPFYRELYSGIELADDLDLRELPTVRKSMLMQRFGEWASDPRLRLAGIESHLELLRDDELFLGNYRCMPSSGTTGQKGILVYDRTEWRQCLSAFLRLSELTGMRPQMGRRVRTASVAATSPLHMTTRFGLSLDLGLYALLRLDARDPIAEQVRALNQHQPEHLVGYASAISLLAIEQLEGRLRITPRTVIATSEVLTEEIARNIEKAWKTRPFNFYASTEGLYAAECEHHHGLHLFEDLGQVEVVDEHNQPVPEGSIGAKLLFTSYVKRTQPLIRYEISDMAAVSTTPCPCGRPLARMLSLTGRNDDILHFQGADQQPIDVAPLTLGSALSPISELRQSKIIHDHQGLHTLIAVRDDASAANTAELVKTALLTRLREQGISPPELDVTVVSNIPRQPGHSGKFKAIESRIGKPPFRLPPAGG